MNRIEQIILNSLTTNLDFTRKVLPFLKEEYFQSSQEEQIAFVTIRDYFQKYGSLPTRAALEIEINKVVDISETGYKKLKSLVSSITDNELPTQDFDWLIDNTEKFCQDKALYNAIMDSIQVIEEDDGHENKKGLSKTGIPNLLSNALAVSFDNKIGHNFTAEAETRYDYYHQKVSKLPFDIDILNDITDGGLVPKSLNILMAGPGTGKSLAMCHFAANNLLAGKNVLYITLEMSELEIGRRIDANLLDVEIGSVKNIKKGELVRKVDALKLKTAGRLIIKEYPPVAAHTGHFRHLLDELKLKEKFRPDIIYVDYLNICASSRIKMGGSVNSYTYIKSVAEELRGIGVEFSVPVVTATQVNRGNWGNSDVDLDGVSESFGIAATADLLIAIVSNDQLAQLGQFMMKQLKNRYGDLNKDRKFLVGVDKAKMRLYNLEASAQNLIQATNTVQPSARPSSSMGGGPLNPSNKSKFDSLNFY